MSNPSPSAPSRWNASTILKLVVIVALVVAFFSYRSYRFRQFGTGHATVGEVAPDFELPRYGQKDDVIKLSDYKGQIVLLDFWATWCVPCKRQVKDLRHVSGVFADDDVHIISVNCDENSRKRGRAIHNFMHQNYMSFPVALDDHHVQISYDVRKHPTLILIGRDGTIQRFFSGVTHASHIKKAIQMEKERTKNMVSASGNLPPASKP